MMAWLRDWADWWHGRNLNRLDLVACLHPTPPGFTKCKFKRAYCLTCGQVFKC